MKMRCLFIHMKNCVEHPQARISCFKSPHIFFKDLSDHCSFLHHAVGILHIPNLNNDLREQMLLMTILYLIVIILNYSIFPFLLSIIFFHSLVKQFVINSPEVSLHKYNILTYPVGIYILCHKYPVIMF